MASNKNFIYGIARVRKGGKEIGWIEKGSFDWGGKKPESIEVEAEQIPDAPVLVLLQKNGSIEPTFNIIQLDYANLHEALGGTLIGNAPDYTGWKAPSKLVQINDEWEIEFVSGRTVRIPNATLLANLGGKLTLTEVSKLECQLKIQKPDDEDAPYQITDGGVQVNAQSAPEVKTEDPSSGD